MLPLRQAKPDLRYGTNGARQFREAKVVEAAGVETLGDVFRNWLMVHEFWSKCFTDQQFPAANSSTVVIATQRDST